ncbi:MAG: hypothetical protein HWE18_09315 [Gammaproteobacteria bacterium]|nr:hypothetical protein [Gammaproteobacteria bacterium]
MNKEQAFNRIATATIKALKEQAEMGKVNAKTTETVYNAIEAAFNQEYLALFAKLDDSKTALEFIAKGEDLDIKQAVALAQQTLSKLAAN